MKQFCLLFSILLLTVLYYSCDLLEEHPVKSMSSFRSISANGSVTFKLVQGEEKTKALSTSMADANYSVSNGTLNVNGNGTMTIAVGGYTSINCNACNVESSGALITIRWSCPYMRAQLNSPTSMLVGIYN